MNSIAATLLQLALSLLMSVNNSSATDAMREQAITVATQAMQFVTQSLSEGTTNTTVVATNSTNTSTNVATSPATVAEQPSTTSAAIGGSCGSASGQTVSSIPVYNLCSVGSPSPVYGSGPWYWTCAGQNGGATMQCAAASLTNSATAMTTSQTVATTATTNTNSTAANVATQSNATVANSTVSASAQTPYVPVAPVVPYTAPYVAPATPYVAPAACVNAPAGPNPATVPGALSPTPITRPLSATIDMPIAPTPGETWSAYLSSLNNSNGNYQNGGNSTSISVIQNIAMSNGKPLLTDEYTTSNPPDAASVLGAQSLGQAVRISDPTGVAWPIDILPTDNYVNIAKEDGLNLPYDQDTASYLQVQVEYEMETKGNVDSPVVIAAVQATLENYGFSPEIVDVFNHGNSTEANGVQTLDNPLYPCQTIVMLTTLYSGQVNWTVQSSNPSVAVTGIDSSGNIKITAIAPGTATITGNPAAGSASGLQALDFVVNVTPSGSQ